MRHANIKNSFPLILHALIAYRLPRRSLAAKHRLEYMPKDIDLPLVLAQHQRINGVTTEVKFDLEKLVGGDNYSPTLTNRGFSSGLDW